MGSAMAPFDMRFILMKIRKAKKYNSYVKLAFAGLAGSGKTCTALETATYLSEKRIALIEGDYPFAADKYAKDSPDDPGFGYTFDTIELALDDKDVDIDKSYNPKRFIEAIKTIYATGEYDVLVIDGLSSEWEGAGGVLEWVDTLKKGDNGKTREAWSIATPEHRRLFTYILRIKMHVIVTMRAKKETVTIPDERDSKVKVKKIVLDPIQREDVPYLFDVLCFLDEKQIRIDTSHCPSLPEGTVVDRSGPLLAQTLREWLKGAPMPDRPEYDPDAPEQTETVALLVRKAQGRAAKCAGVIDVETWETYVAKVLGKSKATSQLTIEDVAIINADLTLLEREKPAVRQGQDVVTSTAHPQSQPATQQETRQPDESFDPLNATLLATESQLDSIRKLYERIGKPTPATEGRVTYTEAKEQIAQLSQEYRQSRAKVS
jgi:hypothetical protein